MNNTNACRHLCFTHSLPHVTLRHTTLYIFYHSLCICTATYYKAYNFTPTLLSGYVHNLVLRIMGLSNTWGASEGVLPVFMLYAALYFGLMRNGVRSFFKKLGLTGRREAPPGSSSGVRVMKFQPGCREKLKCIFCLRKAKEGEQIAILPCNHAFHKACLDHWLQQHCLCPLCKLSLHQIIKSEEPQLSEDLKTLWFSGF